MYIKNNSDNKGFTLIEVLFASAILVITIIAAWSGFISAIDNVKKAKEIRLAVDDVQDVMEKIQGMSFNNITEVLPSGHQIDEAMIGGYQLPDERIVINYPSGTNSDPLVIEVDISWTDVLGDTKEKRFRAMRTSI